MITVFQSVILGIIQGLTEFIPVSSSGHLLILPSLFNWPQQTLSFDITMHLGTSLALLLYFKKDYLELLKSFNKDIYKSIQIKRISINELSDSSKLSLNIIVSMFPALLVGFLFDDILENIFRNVNWGVLFLIAGSFLMLFAEISYSKNKKKINSINKINFKNALIIGLYQCLALLSGFSRSGSTISAGMILGYTREVSARFSFLMSLPIILSAGLYKLLTVNVDEFINIVTLYGFIFSFLSGILAIKVLLKFLKSNNLYIFIAYRLILSLIIYLFVIL